MFLIFVYYYYFEGRYSGWNWWICGCPQQVSIDQSVLHYTWKDIAVDQINYI